MGVLGQSRDQGAASVTPNATGPMDRTGLFSNIGAEFRGAVAGPHSTRVGEAIYQKRYYDQIIGALQAEGEQGEDPLTITTNPTNVKRPFRNPYVSGPSENLLNPNYNPLTSLYGGGDQREIGQIWAAVERVRARGKKDFLKQFPNAAAIEALANQTRQQQQAAAQAVTSRASTVGKVGGFIGGMAGSVASLDPENVVGGGFGTATGKTFARTLIKRSVEGAGVNAAAAVVAAPGQVADARRLGQEMTTGDIVHQVGEAAGIGAVFGGAHVIIPEVHSKVTATAGKVADKVTSIPPVRDALVARSIAAGTIDDHRMLNEWMRTHHPDGIVDTSTPDERAAAHVILRDTAAKETSPLHPEAVGANDHRLDAVAQSLGVTMKAPDVPTPAPISTPTVRDRTDSPSPRRPAAYEQAVHSAEGTGKNPDSSADGHFQFTRGTWLEYAPRVANTAGMSEAQILALRHDLPTATAAEKLFRGDNARYLRDRGLEDSPGNLSLAHFLGKRDAARVLRADPNTPISSVVDATSISHNRNVFKNIRNADDMIAWAHKRIGAAVDHPVARADAVPDADLLDAEDYSDTPYERATFRPDELPSATPAEHIEGEHWDHIQSGEVVLYERANGERVVVDGDKRLAMAQRLYAEDPSIQVHATVLREADGISEDMARAVGTLKNVNLGRGSLEDRMGAVADMPDAAEALKAPESQAAVEHIAALPYEDFGKVLNGSEPDAAFLSFMGGEPLHYQGFDQQPYVARVIKSEWGVHSLEVSKPDGEVVQSPIMPNNQLESFYRNTLKDTAHAKELVTGAAEASGLAGEPPRETGSRDAAAEADRLLSEGDGPGLFEHAVAARDAAEPFSEPTGEGAKQQTALLEHDLRMDDTRTVNLKKWLGESKAVDADGNPLVLYHGAPDARFLAEGGTFKGQGERFGVGSDEKGVHWFAASEAVAKTYADDHRAFDYQNAEPSVVPAYLKIENPLIIDAQGKHWRDAQRRGKTRDVIKQAQEDGHDGVIIRNVVDEYNHLHGTKGGRATDTYAVFDSRQIKSVDNSGRFDPESRNIFDPVTEAVAEPPPPLFDLPETGYRVSEEGEARPLKDILDEAQSDELAAKALRECLTGGEA